MDKKILLVNTLQSTFSNKDLQKLIKKNTLIKPDGALHLLLDGPPLRVLIANVHQHSALEN